MIALGHQNNLKKMSILNYPRIATAANLSEIKYRPDIDGLRAIAVVSVLLFHAFPGLFPSGFIGVDIFFVISGFLISTIIYDDITNNRFSITKFYERRINRIFPALFIVMASCLAFGWIALFPDELEQLGKHAAGGSAFISNLVLYNESGYFDTSSEIKPLLHLWSLGIEEQFYIFWPIILWISWKARISIILVAIALFLASLSLNITNISVDQAGTFYLPHTRAWELLMGAILSVAVRYSIQPSNTILSACSITGFAMLFLGFITIKSGSAFPGWQAIMPTLGTALIIYGGVTAYPNRLISNKIFVWIGLISYPLYLWHWPLISFPRIIMGEDQPAHVNTIALAAAVCLASITYLAIEKPLKRFPSKFKAISLFGLMGCTGIFGYYVYQNDGMPTRAAVVKTQEFNAQFVGPLWQYERNDICLKQAGHPNIDGYGWWFCYMNHDRSPEIMIIGTSYANHLFPGLAEIPDLKDKAIMSIGACSIASGEHQNHGATTVDPCSGSRPYEERNLVNSIMDRSQNLKHVIIGGLFAKKDPEYISSVLRRIDELEARSVSLTIVEPHITRPGDLKKCYSRPLSPAKEDCKLPISERDKVEENFSALKHAISERHPSVRFFDPNDTFCDVSECSLTIDGMPIYRDEYSHLSEYASYKVARRFIEWAAGVGLDLSK